MKANALIRFTGFTAGLHVGSVAKFRAILSGLSLKPDEADRFWDMYLGDVPLEGATVLDPFVGGGTSLIEAERCGARVIGYDIDPVAPFITRFELEARTLDPTARDVIGSYFLRSIVAENVIVCQ